jgi:uncharacterized protein
MNQKKGQLVIWTLKGMLWHRVEEELQHRGDQCAIVEGGHQPANDKLVELRGVTKKKEARRRKTRKIGMLLAIGYRH